MAEQVINCRECVKECKEQGGMCWPPTFEECLGAQDDGYDANEAFDLHKLVAHVMTIVGGHHRCEKGHRVEAHPADAMRAAGMEPML